MNWESLKLFLAIAKSGSLSGAAKKLNINHSTVFRRLNSLEKELGVRLFERLKEGYQLTGTGQEMLVYAEQIENDFDSLERHIVAKDFQPQGTVSVTAPYNIAYRYLAKHLTVFRQLYPKIDLEILVSNEAFNISNRQADIAIRATTSPPDSLVGRKVADIHWSFYASKTYISKHGKLNSVKQLKEHNLIGAAGFMRHLPAFVWQEQHLSEHISLRCDELVAMSYFAENNYGLALLPDDQIRPQLEKLTINTPIETSQLWILTHPDLRHVERIKLVMQHLYKALSLEFSEEHQIN